MSFPMASRFSHYTPCSPSPTAYNIPHVFDDSGSNRSGTWTKPFLFTGHKCDENCTLNTCKKEYKETRAGLFKRPLISKRYSLDPNTLKSNGATQKTTEGAQNKVPEHFKANLSLSLSENKENILSPQRKISSHIPRFKKNVTEGQAPSFVIHPRDIHNCYNLDKKEISPPTNSFNRYSAERKSIKPIKKNDRSTDSMDDDSLEKEELLNTDGHILKKKRPFNKSYTVLPRVDENPQEAHSNASSAARATTENKVANDIKYKHKNTSIAKTDEDPKYADESQNVDRDSSFSLSKLLLKDSELAKELSEASRTSKYYEITSKEIGPRQEPGTEQDSQSSDINADSDQRRSEKLRPCDISGLEDCSVIFLVSEEFIDDEYDSYIKGLNGAKSYLQVSQNKELYDMAKYLVSVYVQDYGSFATHNSSERSTSNIEMETKMEKSVRTKIRRFFTRRKRNISGGNKNLCNGIESVIKQAIKELKGEFQMEIYKRTNEKLDQLMSDMKNSILKASEDIEIKCERTTENLISRLQNMAMKS